MGALDRVIAKTEGKESGEVSGSRLYQCVRGRGLERGCLSQQGNGVLLALPALPSHSLAIPPSCDTGTKTHFKLGFMFPAAC